MYTVYTIVEETSAPTFSKRTQDIKEASPKTPLPRMAEFHYQKAQSFVQKLGGDCYTMSDWNWWRKFSSDSPLFEERAISLHSDRYFPGCTTFQIWKRLISEKEWNFFTNSETFLSFYGENHISTACSCFQVVLFLNKFCIHHSDFIAFWKIFNVIHINYPDILFISL